MPASSPFTRLWQAKVPILLGAAVVLLVVATLRANDQRECRQVCVKYRFADGVYTRERFHGWPLPVRDRGRQAGAGPAARAALSLEPTPRMPVQTLLAVEDLRVDIPTPAGTLHAVRDVDLQSSAARRCASSANPAAARP